MEDAARVGFSDEFIRQQMKLPYEKQSIPIERLQHGDALLPFQAWREKADKILY